MVVPRLVPIVTPAAFRSAQSRNFPASPRCTSGTNALRPQQKPESVATGTTGKLIEQLSAKIPTQRADTDLDKMTAIQARADAVGRLIKARLADPNRVRVEGHADSDPIASNATPEGRQQNRRVEVIINNPSTAAR